MSNHEASLREFLANNCSQIAQFLGIGQAEIELLNNASQDILEKSEEIISEMTEEFFRDPESARIFQEAGLTREVSQEISQEMGAK